MRPSTHHLPPGHHGAGCHGAGHSASRALLAVARAALYGVAISAIAAGAALAQQPGDAAAGRAPPGAPPARVTRAAAIVEALHANPTIRVAAEQIGQSRARVRQAVALPEPVLGFTLLGDRPELRPGRPTETDLALGITIPFPTKIMLRGRVARGDLTGAEAGYDLQRQLVVLQTNLAYDSLLVSLLHRRDLEEARTLTHRFLQRTRARFNAGAVPRLDVVKAQVDVAQAENDLIANERGIAGARVALNRLLGRALGAPIEPPTRSASRRAARARLPREAGDGARGPSCAVRGARAGVDAAARLAQQYFLPDVTLGRRPQQHLREPAGYTTSIGIDVPIFFWQHQRGEVAEAKHRELELEASYRDVTAQVGRTCATRTPPHPRRCARSFPARRAGAGGAEAYRAVSASYGLGGSSALEVIDAQRTLLDAQTQYTTALARAQRCRRRSRARDGRAARLHPELRDRMT